MEERERRRELRRERLREREGGRLSVIQFSSAILSRSK